MNTVTPKDIADDAVVLDVREQDEYDAGHAPRAIHIPLGDLPNRLNELPEVDGDLPVVCRSGARSGRAGHEARRRVECHAPILAKGATGCSRAETIES